MAFAIICPVAPGALDRLKALRADHLTYIDTHRDLILFGGPARAPDGAPETMIIVLKTDSRAEADAFIENEPYTASASVFSDVAVRPWSQVVPESTPGAIRAAIAAERPSQEPR